MSTVALRAAGLTKRYGRAVALDGLDLEATAGEVHAFLGPNGAGKTATIRILLGLLRKDGGEVSLLGGDPWRDAVELHRRLAYVPGDMTLWPGLTGAEIIDLLGDLRGAAVPAEPLIWLCGIALALSAAGLAGLRRRDLGDLGPAGLAAPVRDWLADYVRQSNEISQQGASAAPARPPDPMP